MKLFEILQKLNDGDAANGTAHVGICNDIVSVDKKGNNGYVKIGIPGNVAQEIVLDPDKKALMLLIIDRKEYEAIKEQSAPLNGPEAVFGFAGWLTSQPKEFILSDHHDAAVIADAVKLFLEANNFSVSDVRNDFHKTLKHPTA
jgi:hypothetical protein